MTMTEAVETVLRVEARRQAGKKSNVKATLNGQKVFITDFTCSGKDLKFFYRPLDAGENFRDPRPFKEYSL